MDTLLSLKPRQSKEPNAVTGTKDTEVAARIVSIGNTNQEYKNAAGVTKSYRIATVEVNINGTVTRTTASVPSKALDRVAVGDIKWATVRKTEQGNSMLSVGTLDAGAMLDANAFDAWTAEASGAAPVVAQAPVNAEA